MASDDSSMGEDQQLPEQRVGAAMREAREASGLSLRQMAKQLHYGSHTTLSGYERGAIMPTEQVIVGYEKILGLKAGALKTVLEEACVERHGDAWPKRRVHIPAQFVDEGAPISPSVAPRFRPTGTQLIVLGILSTAIVSLVLIITFRNPSKPAGAQPPAPNPIGNVADGADPKESQCSLDPNAETLDSAEVDLNGRPVGLIELRYSPQCGVAWPRFEPFKLAKIPHAAIIHVDVIRPNSDNLRMPYQAGYVGAAVYGNVLRSTEHCVYAAGHIETGGQRVSESRTNCFRGRTPTGAVG